MYNAKCQLSTICYNVNGTMKRRKNIHYLKERRQNYVTTYTISENVHMRKYPCTQSFNFKSRLWQVRMRRADSRSRVVTYKEQKL